MMGWLLYGAIGFFAPLILSIVLHQLKRRGVRCCLFGWHTYAVLRPLTTHLDKIYCVRCRRVFVSERGFRRPLPWDQEWTNLESLLKSIEDVADAFGIELSNRVAPRHVREAEEIIEKGGL